MSPVLGTLLVLILSLIIYIGYLSYKANNFFKERGIPQLKPCLFFGHLLDVILQRSTPSDLIEKACNTYPNSSMVGFVSFLTPNLIVKDTSYIEKVLIKDFSFFMDRGYEIDSSIDPLNVNLINMTGQKWRTIRNKLSPIFTSGKLKNMFDNMSDIGIDLVNCVEKEGKNCVELRQAMGRFAMDTIGFYGYGYNPKSLQNPDTQFQKYGSQITNLSLFQFIKFLINTFCPKLTKWFKISFIRSDVRDFFIDIIKKTIDERVKSGLRRKDFVDLMLQLKEKGHIDVQGKDPNDDYLRMEDNEKNEKIELTDELLIGQAFIFLVAGFEGIASMMTYFLYEMSKNPTIQTKVRQEMYQIIEKHGHINFDSIKDMKYFDICLKESMRKNPPGLGGMRVCTKEYTFPNGYRIKKGEIVMIPTLYIHTNPNIYNEPLKYIPERFQQEYPPCSFMPFGEGPRMCIAMRFAILQVKYGLVKFLTEYEVILNKKTIEPLGFNIKSLLATPKNPVYFDVIKINK